MSELQQSFLFAAYYFLYYAALLVLVILFSNLMSWNRGIFIFNNLFAHIVKLSTKTKGRTNLNSNAALLLYGALLFISYGFIPLVPEQGPQGPSHLLGQSATLETLAISVISLTVLSNVHNYLSFNEKAIVEGSRKTVRSLLYLCPIILVLFTCGDGLPQTNLIHWLEQQSGFHWMIRKLPISFGVTFICALEFLERLKSKNEGLHQDNELLRDFIYYGTVLLWSMIICVLFFGGSDFGDPQGLLKSHLLFSLKTLCIASALQFALVSAFKAGIRPFFERGWALVTVFAIIGIFLQKGLYK